MKTPQTAISRPRPENRAHGSFFRSLRLQTALQALQGAISRPLVTAINDSAGEAAISALNEALAPEQEWTRIAPYREMPNEVGLQVFDRAGAEQMVAAFNSLPERAARLFRGLPVYVGHPDDPRWAQRHPAVRAEAVGRIRDLQVRDDGLYGRIAWNEEGKRLVSGDAAAYAYHSPRWGMIPVPGRSKTFRPVFLHSIGLTNNPNIPDLAIGLNEADRASQSAMKKHIIAFLAALGRPALAEDATDEQFAAAVNEAVPVATSALAAQGELATTKTALTTAQNEVATIKAERDGLQAKLTEQQTVAANERAARADAILVVAVNEGRITAAQVDEWKGKLTAANDFSAVETSLRALKPTVPTGSAAAGLGGRKGEAEADTSKIDAINEAVSEHMKKHGCDHHTAYVAVKKAKPALFSVPA